MSAKKNSAGEEIRFGEAIDELEEILHRVEAEEIDIDELATELKSATALLEICRSKIRKAELEVTQIVQSLEKDDGVDGSTDSED
ncbi:MAG: exodeoxyribonuclease VII small subunit [Acidobacteriota bacterium]